MPVLVLSHREVQELLSIEECIEVQARALTALAQGQVYQPLRSAVVAPGASGVLGLMPSYLSGARGGLYGLKSVCVFPGNSALGKDIHQGAVLLFSGETGELLSVMDASAITAIRTAAVSAVATRLLAREDARDLALVGAGVQARVHIEAMARVRTIRKARVASRSPESARKFADDMGKKTGLQIEPVDSAEKAIREADLIVTATTSREPVVKLEWVAPGAHLNAVGSSVRTTREIDTATIAASSLFVDRRESTINESGDYLKAVSEGAIGPEHIKAEVGEVLIGTRPGRTSASEITLFKSLGLGIEDLASAEYLYGKAAGVRTGSWIDF